LRINDEKVLGGIARLSTNPDFIAFMENVVKKEYDDAVQKAITKKKPGIYQGKAQLAQEIIETVDGAREAHRQRSAQPVSMGASL